MSNSSSGQARKRSKNRKDTLRGRVVHSDALECFEALSQVEKENAEVVADEAEDNAVAICDDLDDECAIFEDYHEEVRLHTK